MVQGLQVFDVFRADRADREAFGPRGSAGEALGLCLDLLEFRLQQVR